MSFSTGDSSLLLRTVIDQIEMASTAKELSIQRNIQKSLEIVADEGRLIQLVLIILDNAAKYTPKGGTIYIKATYLDSFVLIVVDDSGVGIGEKHLPHILEKLYRGDPSQNRDNGGLGLGLAIAQEIISLHYGEISVMSKSRFKIYY